MPDYMWENCYWDMGLSRYTFVGTDVALRHWKPEGKFVIQEELRRHAVETNPRQSSYQLGRPVRTHVNGIRLEPWRKGGYPGFRQPSKNDGSGDETGVNPKKASDRPSTSAPRQRIVLPGASDTDIPWNNRRRGR